MGSFFESQAAEKPQRIDPYDPETMKWLRGMVAQVGDQLRGLIGAAPVEIPSIGAINWGAAPISALDTSAFNKSIYNLSDYLTGVSAYNEKPDIKALSEQIMSAGRENIASAMQNLERRYAAGGGAAGGSPFAAETAEAARRGASDITGKIAELEYGAREAAEGRTLARQQLTAGGLTNVAQLKAELPRLQLQHTQLLQQRNQLELQAEQLKQEGRIAEANSLLEQAQLINQKVQVSGLILSQLLGAMRGDVWQQQYAPSQASEFVSALGPLLMGIGAL